LEGSDGSVVVLAVRYAGLRHVDPRKAPSALSLPFSM